MYTITIYIFRFHPQSKETMTTLSSEYKNYMSIYKVMQVKNLLF